MANRVREGNVAELTPDHKNANKGTKRGRDLHQKSVQRLGMGRSVLADKNGRLIAGNKTAEVAADLGIERTVVVETWGDEVVVVKRMDLDLTDDHGKARELAYADNQVGAVNLDWATEVIQADADAGVEAIQEFWFPDELAGKLGVSLDPSASGAVDTEDEDDSEESEAEEEKPYVRPEYPFKTGDTIRLGVHSLLVGDLGHDEVLFLMRQWQGYTGFQAQVIPSGL